MNIKLKYGKQTLPFEFPSRTVTPHVIEPEFEISQERFMNELLSLLPAEKARYRKVAIAVSDKTRLCGYPEYLPWLTGILMEKGALSSDITFYIAYGSHGKQTEEESFASYGDTYRNFQFVHHDCTDTSIFDNHSTTKRGTPVAFRSDILQSTLLITFGSISHHYFAGYGGGRKMLFPGLASKTAIFHNHGLFLDIPNRRLHPGCQPGKLEGNPLAEDLEEIDSVSPPKISIHGILDSSGKVCRLMIGHTYKDFLKACMVHDGFYRYKGADQFDLVVASAGGYPKDINFIQAHKSVHHASAFVKDGGNLVILLECIDKVGSDYFLKYLKAGSSDAAFSILEKNYEGNGGTALSMMEKTRRIFIHLVTSLDDEVCKTLGVTRITFDRVQDIINDEKGSVAAIANASMLVK